MSALAGVGVFKEMSAVELREAVSVAREVRGSPIEQDADAFLVAAVDKLLKIGGRAEAAGGGGVAERLGAPGAGARVFHGGGQLGGGVAEVFYGWDEAVGEFPIS